eukprot:15365278-Ditylum_brightwellii.AAC.2
MLFARQPNLLSVDLDYLVASGSDRSILDGDKAGVKDDSDVMGQIGANLLAGVCSTPIRAGSNTVGQCAEGWVEGTCM